MKKDRKLDHIILADKAQVSKELADNRFNYEPMLSVHPSEHLHNSEKSPLTLQFASWSLKAPIWISSMTGGTGKAGFINRNLARAAGEFGLGMGLGSCRPLLESDEFFDDFNLKGYMPNSPLMANFGIAQIEKTLLNKKSFDKLVSVLERLKVDGLIVHVNPMQEWFQPEGDRFVQKPLEVIEDLLDKIELPIIVKEVGQGIGPKSLEGLMGLPLAAIEFGAFGGTNFSQLEILRSEKDGADELAMIGHSPLQMVEIINDIKRKRPQTHFVDNFIVSGGIKSFLDGFYLCEKLNACAIYGQAKTMLDHAAKDYDSFAKYIDGQVRGLEFANSYLTVK